MAKSIAQRLSALEKMIARFLKPEKLIATRKTSKKKAKKKKAPRKAKTKAKKRKAKRRAPVIIPAPPLL